MSNNYNNIFNGIDRSPNIPTTDIVQHILARAFNIVQVDDDDALDVVGDELAVDDDLVVDIDLDDDASYLDDDDLDGGFYV
jgi:hypothetical protein